MNSSLFEQFNKPNWLPPRFPALDDPEWKVRFDEATHDIKSSLANAWLWLCNERLKNDPHNGDLLVTILNDKYQWIRDIKPYIDNDLFNRSIFDGSIQKITENVIRFTIDDINIVEKALEPLWFGSREDRIEAVGLVADLLEKRHNSGELPPSFGHIIQNLSWDVVSENPDDLKLKLNASRVSLFYGKQNGTLTTHASLENRVWSALMKCNRYNIHNFNDVYGTPALETILSINPIIAAHNLPYLMNDIREPVKRSALYPRKFGVAGAVGKPEEKITDYDILRAWIPSKTSEWDVAESLDIPFQETCERIVSNALNLDALELHSLPNNLDIA